MRKGRSECIPVLSGPPIVNCDIAPGIHLVLVQLCAQVPLSPAEEPHPFTLWTVCFFNVLLLCSFNNKLPYVYEYLMFHSNESYVDTVTALFRTGATTPACAWQQLRYDDLRLRLQIFLLSRLVLPTRM